jgi:hypothetical protein
MPSFLVLENDCEASLKTEEVIAAYRRGSNPTKIQAVRKLDELVILNLQPSDPTLDWAWSDVPKFDSSGHFSPKTAEKYVTYPSGRCHITWTHKAEACSQSLIIISDSLRQLTFTKAVNKHTFKIHKHLIGIDLYFQLTEIKPMRSPPRKHHSLHVRSKCENMSQHILE